MVFQMSVHLLLAFTSAKGCVEIKKTDTAMTPLDITVSKNDTITFTHKLKVVLEAQVLKFHGTSQ